MLVSRSQAPFPGNSLRRTPAGILCAIVSHPADVMVSKLNANRHPGEAFGGAMKRIYGDIGFGGLWNGLVIRIFMIGTLTSFRKRPQYQFKTLRLTSLQNGASTTLSRFTWACPRLAGLLRRKRPPNRRSYFDAQTPLIAERLLLAAWKRALTLSAL